MALSVAPTRVKICGPTQSPPGKQKLILLSFPGRAISRWHFSQRSIASDPFNLEGFRNCGGSPHSSLSQPSHLHRVGAGHAGPPRVLPFRQRPQTKGYLTEHQRTWPKKIFCASRSLKGNTRTTVKFGKALELNAMHSKKSGLDEIALKVWPTSEGIVGYFRKQHKSLI